MTNPTLAEILDAIDSPDEETIVTRRHAATVIAIQLELPGKGWPGEGAAAEVKRAQDARRIHFTRWRVVTGHLGDGGER